MSWMTCHIPSSSILYNFKKHLHEVIRHIAEHTLSNTEKEEGCLSGLLFSSGLTTSQLALPSVRSEAPSTNSQLRRFTNVQTTPPNKYSGFCYLLTSNPFSGASLHVRTSLSTLLCVWSILVRAPDHICMRILFSLNLKDRLVVILHTSNRSSQSWHHLFPGFPQSLPHSSSAHSCPLLTSFQNGSHSDPVRMKCSWIV